MALRAKVLDDGACLIDILCHVLCVGAVYAEKVLAICQLLDYGKCETEFTPRSKSLMVSSPFYHGRQSAENVKTERSATHLWQPRKEMAKASFRGTVWKGMSDC